MNGGTQGRGAMRAAAAGFVLLALGWMAGCSGGSAAMLGGLPRGTTVLDANQTLALTASVANDTLHQGVTWAVAGGGTLGSSVCTPVGSGTQCAIVYTPPATVSGSLSATVTATEVANSSQTLAYAITVHPALVIASPATLPAATTGASYTATLTATGGTGTVSWSVSSGTLPAGLTLSPAGVLSGTPTGAGSGSFTVQAADQATLPNLQMQAETLAVNAPLPVITAATLPSAPVGQTYAQQLSFTGGAGPGTFAIVSGSLPAASGLLLSASGLISGTPPASASGTTYSFSVAVTSGGQTSAAVPFSIGVVTALAVASPAALPGATTGTAYTYQLAASGGSGAGDTWTLVSGTLPAGLASLPASGLLSFTPTAAGTFPFVVRVTDSAGNSATAAESLTVTTVALTVSTTTLPATSLGAAYSQQLAYTGGSGGTATWAVASGTLPSGLTLSPSGLLAGMPTVAGTFPFGVTVTVGGQSSAVQALTVTVSSLMVASAAAVSGEVGLPFRDVLAATGGTVPYTWSVASGGAAAGSATLPAGLTLSAAGVLSGTPTGTAGSFAVTVQVQDAAGSTASQSLTITLAAARTGAGNALLSGQYALLMNGFDAAGNPVAMAGSFVADGAGNILSGTLDSNGTAAGPKLNAALVASTYAIGADHRGKMLLSTAAGSLTVTLALRTAGGLTSTSSGGGYMSAFDGSGQTLSGVVLQQTPAAFSTSAVQGGYAFGLSGFQTGVGTHAALVGEMQLTGSTGTLASGEFVESTRGATPVVPTGGTYAIGTTGRGTVSLAAAGGTVNLIVYPVSATQLLLLSGDTPSSTQPLLSGQAAAQTIANGSFGTGSLNGTAVATMQHVLTATAVPGAAVQVGLLTFSGVASVSVAEDLNTAGTASTVTQSGTYTVAANGRATLALGTGIGGCINCAVPETLAYLAGLNRGFTLDFQAGTGTGTLEPQTAGTYTAASLSGSYASGTVQPVALAALDTAVLTASGTGTANQTADVAQTTLLTPDVASSLTLTVAANGRATVTGSGGSNAVLYFVSPTRGLMVSLAAGVPVVQEVQ